MRAIRRDLADVAIDRKIVDRDYQIDCIEALSTEVSRGRRKLLVEMATGTDRTCMAAFIKRLFEADTVTRVLFLVNRMALAHQAEDAFTNHLRDHPCHVLRPHRGFNRAKRITVTTFQTIIAEYRALSPGYQSRAATLHVVSIPPFRSPINYFANQPASSLEGRYALIKRLIAA